MILCVSSEAGIIIYMQRTQEENFAFFGAEMRPLSYQHVITSGWAVVFRPSPVVGAVLLKTGRRDREP
jgi:hypothetical protein